MASRHLTGNDSDFLRVVLPACGAGRIDEVRKYLNDPRDFARWTGPHGRTMLWEAARRGRLDIARLLVEETESDIHAFGCYFRETRLELSCWYIARHGQHTEVAGLLEKHGAGWDLFSACYAAELETVQQLLHQDAGAANQPYHRDISYNGYRSWPLCYAVCSRETRIARVLLDAGADANAHPDILFDALDTHQPEMVDLLLAAGAEPHARHGRHWIADDTMLALARKHGHRIDAESAPPEKWPALVDACRGNHNAPDDPGRVRSLLTRGHDVNVRDYKHKTALHRAAQADFVEITRLLLERGADIEARDEHNQTPLFDAAFHGRPGSLEVLLDASADLEALDHRGETAVFAAVRGGRVNTLTMLHERGAALDAPNSKGKTPAEVAARSRKIGIEEVRAYRDGTDP